MDHDASSTFSSATTKRDDPPTGDKALAYTSKVPVLPRADNPELCRSQWESVTYWLTEFCEYHSIHYPTCVTYVVMAFLLSEDAINGRVNFVDLWYLFPVQQATFEVAFQTIFQKFPGYRNLGIPLFTDYGGDIAKYLVPPWTWYRLVPPKQEPQDMPSTGRTKRDMGG